ncbi:hypothetical protein GP5015_536 [gamma proteobacterium HTCC5015]|nr:hypothetical protein GP5015_536 [gamma proteobacterium HTCC5015]
MVKHKMLCFCGGKAVGSLWISRAQKWPHLSLLGHEWQGGFIYRHYADYGL